MYTESAGLLQGIKIYLKFKSDFKTFIESFLTCYVLITVITFT